MFDIVYLSSETVLITKKVKNKLSQLPSPQPAAHHQQTGRVCAFVYLCECYMYCAWIKQWCYSVKGTETAFVVVIDSFVTEMYRCNK